MFSVATGREVESYRCRSTRFRLPSICCPVTASACRRINMSPAFLLLGRYQAAGLCHVLEHRQTLGVESNVLSISLHQETFVLGLTDMMKWKWNVNPRCILTKHKCLFLTVVRYINIQHLIFMNLTRTAQIVLKAHMYGM